MRLRISDTRSYAAEFTAETQAEFSLGLYEALRRYGRHFTSQRRTIPRPHLHVYTDTFHGRWIDAGYGRGTHIVLYADMMQNTAYLAEIWERCQSADKNVASMSRQLSGLFDWAPTQIIDHGEAE